MQEEYIKTPDDLRLALAVKTAPTAADLATDIWDAEYNCSYSADGTKLLDAENFPGTVKVKDGTQIICDNVFAFQDYMAENRKIGEEIPEDERVSFLDKVYLPSSVTHIGNSAFKECGWIRSVKLPVSLKVIGDEAFSGCWELKQIGFPAELLSVGDNAFFECFSLESVRINKGLKRIGAWAFSFCEELKEITLPDGLFEIGQDAFYGCRKLKKIFVPAWAREMYEEILPANMQKYVRIK